MSDFFTICQAKKNAAKNAHIADVFAAIGANQQGKT